VNTPLRLLVPLLVLCVSPAAQSAIPPVDPSTMPLLDSSIFEWDELKVRPTAVGVRRDVANNPTATLSVFESHISTLNVGNASHAPHRHPQEEIIIVKEGRLEVHINGKTYPAGPGSVLFYATDDAHAVRNTGTTPATYWVVNLASAATHTPSAHRANPSVHSQVFEWDKLEASPTAFGARRSVFRGSTVTLNSLSVDATTINAGQSSHAAHRHPDEELVILKEGTLEVNLDGRIRRVGAGSLLFFGSNDFHHMRNVGDTPATFYVIRMVTEATPAALGR